jgi:hypothetical protein
MAAVRAFVSALMSKGVLSPGWYSILTGLAMLYVAYLLGSAADTDSAAPFVAVVFGAAGLGMTARGIRSERRRERSS